MPIYKLTLAYDGTDYAGWQVQPNSLSIQAVVQEKLKILLKRETDLTGAGRTDAGVHARAQTAHFRAAHPLDPFKFSYSLNALLPSDIRVTQLHEVPEDFHARYSAMGKRYTYHLRLAPWHDPFRRLYAWHIPYSHFDLDKVRSACEKLKGTHNFKGFAAQAAEGVASYDPIRTLRRLELIEGEETILIFEADGFLYKMVRNLTGTLVDIGRGHLAIETIDQVFAHEDRRFAGQTAPAHGLFLDRVLY